MKSYVRNTINLSCAKILLTSVINENIVNIQLIVDRCVLDATSCWDANCTTPIKNSKINIARIIGTALGHMNLKCQQFAMKLNINKQYDGA